MARTVLAFLVKDDQKEANVVCRQLGYSSSVSYATTAVYGQGSGQVWMDQVACAGDEPGLEGCARAVGGGPWALVVQHVSVAHWPLPGMIFEPWCSVVE